MGLSVAQLQEQILDYDDLWRTVYEHKPNMLQNEQPDSSGPTSRYTNHTGSIFDHQNEIKIRDYYKTRKRLAVLRMILMRCEILYFTANMLEYKHWENPDSFSDSQCYYSKIRKLTMRAGQLAESLDSREQQARCQYWAGHGCGGMRDWLAAKDHFAAAIKLDIPYGVEPHARPGIKGLKRNEKEDVPFLLEAVKGNHEGYLRKNSSICHKDFRAPSWMPEHDRLTRKPRNQNERNLRSTRNDDVLAGSNQAKNGHMCKRVWQTLNEAEKQYVLHGSQFSKKYYDSTNHNHLDYICRAVTSQDRNDNKSSYSSSPASSNYSSQNTTPPMKSLDDEIAGIEDYDVSSKNTTPEMKTLEDELAGFEGYESSSSSRSSSLSLSPLFTIKELPTRLEDRRGLKLVPIETSNNMSMNLGQAVRGSPDAAEGTNSDSPVDSVLGSFTAADGVGLGIHSPVDSHHGKDDMVDARQGEAKCVGDFKE